MIHITQTKPSKDDWEHHLLLNLGKPCVCLSSAVLGGGFTKSQYLINRSVSKNWRGDDPVASMRDYAQDLHLDADTCIGLMTAVSTQDTKMIELQKDDWVVRALVTAGVGNAARAGGHNPLDDSQLTVGTINIILILFGSLSQAGMIAAVQTATEAKAAALQDLNTQTRFSEAATGTTTDAIAIVNYLNEPQSEYAGLATTPGYLIGQCVYKAVKAALEG